MMMVVVLRRTKLAKHYQLTSCPGPRRSIVFMTVSGRKGLWGSEHYTNHPILWKRLLDLNIGMIGRIGEEYLKDKDSSVIFMLSGMTN
jgi:hypothetical protein